MSKKQLTFSEFTDLLQAETHRGIIDGRNVIEMILHNKLPKVIYDIEGVARLAVERIEDKLEITKYNTNLSTQKLSEVY